MLQASHQLQAFPDTSAFLELLNQEEAEHPVFLPEVLFCRLSSWHSSWHHTSYSLQEPVWVARAPGRLDVMGGIADYSGALVLQLPLAQACHAACQQRQVAAQCLVCDTNGRADRLPVCGRTACFTWSPWLQTSAQSSTGTSAARSRLASCWAAQSSRMRTHSKSAASWASASGAALAVTSAGTPRASSGLPASSAEQQSARLLQTHAGALKALVRCRWVAYSVGALVVLAQELGTPFSRGLTLLISSAVPEGKGVSSSAALEVASLQAICAACGVQLQGDQCALLCQKVGCSSCARRSWSATGLRRDLSARSGARPVLSVQQACTDGPQPPRARSAVLCLCRWRTWWWVHPVA